MEDKKKFLSKNKKISTILFIVIGIPFTVMLIATIVMLCITDAKAASKFIITTASLFLPFIASLVYRILIYQIKLLEYEANDLDITIYAGISHYYLYVDDNLLDEYENEFEFSTITLEGNSHGCNIEASISPMKKVKLTVNGKLVNPKNK